MCGYFCTGFIDSMLKGRSLLEYTNSFSPNKIISIESKYNKMMKMYCNVWDKYRKLKNC